MRRERMILREKYEGSVSNNLVLIYPLISYQNEFKIEKVYTAQEKFLRRQIEQKRDIALEMAGGVARKVDFNVG